MVFPNWARKLQDIVVQTKHVGNMIWASDFQIWQESYRKLWYKLSIGILNWASELPKAIGIESTGYKKWCSKWVRWDKKWRSELGK